LLGAITELWVDYLTRVEALRVSVGLEAYAQADPLVKYKSQASEMFQSLLRDIRAAVIGRIFLYQPRVSAAQTEPAAVSGRHPASPGGTENVEGTGVKALPSPSSGPNQAQSSGKKRKRHRH
jgi:preprotein translocase subunit SecA